MVKNILLTLLTFVSLNGFSQITKIAQSNYTILNVSSDNTNRPVEDAFDGDPYS